VSRVRARKTASSRAEETLRALDPAWGELVDRHGPCTLRKRRSPDPFGALVRTVIAQRVSTKAAATVALRLGVLLEGEISVARVLETPLAGLRSVGLPERKALAIQALARSSADGSLPLTRLGRWSNRRVTEGLSAIPGIGPWTAQVFMIFSLARPDVFPEGDLGLQEGIRVTFGLQQRPTPRQARERAEAWAPYRSTAAWYLWRAADPTPSDA